MAAEAHTNVHLLLDVNLRGVPLPFYTCRVPAGFPSPAEEHLGDTLDVSKLLIQRPAATFFVRVSGDSLQDSGIQDGDILVVDRSLAPRSGQIIIAVIDGEMTAKILERRPHGVRLLPANPRYAPISLREGQELNVWGVVTGLVRANMAGGGQCSRSWTYSLPYATIHSCNGGGCYMAAKPDVMLLKRFSAAL